MIASLLIHPEKGRLRVRGSKFTDPDKTSLLFGLNGVRKAVLNPETQSLLVEYDKNSEQEVFEALANLNEDFPDELQKYLTLRIKNEEKLLKFGELLKRNTKVSKKKAKSDFFILSAVTLAVLGTGFLGAGKLHAQSALLLSAMLVEHIITHRKSFTS